MADRSRQLKLGGQGVWVVAAKLPMVLALEMSADTLMGSEMVCAIAGDEKARDA